MNREGTGRLCCTPPASSCPVPVGGTGSRVPPSNGEPILGRAQGSLLAQAEGSLPPPPCPESSSPSCHPAPALGWEPGLRGLPAWLRPSRLLSQWDPCLQLPGRWRGSIGRCRPRLRAVLGQVWAAEPSPRQGDGMRHPNLPQNGVLLPGSSSAWQGKQGHSWMVGGATRWELKHLVQPAVLRCSRAQGYGHPWTRSQPKKTPGEAAQGGQGGIATS